MPQLSSAGLHRGVSQLRLRASRSARLWLLGARRALGYVALRARHARALRSGAVSRAELDQRFVVRTAEDVARELGQMKGVMMKAGQLVSFIAETLPEDARAALATLQADAPPMAPELAEQVVEEELGARPRRLFRRWEAEPIAAASIGQVHRAVLRDGRTVAVKVQYPGVGKAIGADLANAELLYGVFSALALKGLDTKALVDELRARFGDELDYRKEAANQQLFHDLFAGHPVISVPAVVAGLCTERVLVTEWAEGETWASFQATASPAARATAAEAIFRFAQACVYRHGTFNGDPHPGNYRFQPDGRVTFLDFGLVKRFTASETAKLWPLVDPLLAGDRAGTVARMVDAGFLPADHGLDPEEVWAYVSAPYQPYLVEEFTFTRGYLAEVLGTLTDVRGPSRRVVEKLNLPPSFVILDRLVWGVSALLGQLEARNRWRAILAEYRDGSPPATELGHREAAWRAAREA
ncbi:MAG: AarF/ABC1/UbiB kinase family protein [Acidimicrobiia bacterium]|nr:AarF/ABC1/UbiB kinase family protein [Acidimicrobiia bacterium]